VTACPHRPARARDNLDMPLASQFDRSRRAHRGWPRWQFATHGRLSNLLWRLGRDSSRLRKRIEDSV